MKEMEFVTLEPLRCPSCEHPLSSPSVDIDFCDKEKIIWQSVVVESPDCIPTEEKDNSNGIITTRPAKVFIRKIQTK